MILYTIFVSSLLLMVLVLNFVDIKNFIYKKRTVYRTDKVSWHFKEVIRDDGYVIQRWQLTEEQWKQHIREEKLKRLIV